MRGAETTGYRRQGYCRVGLDLVHWNDDVEGGNAYFEAALHQLKGSPHVSDIRNFGFAGIRCRSTQSTNLWLNAS